MSKTYKRKWFHGGGIIRQRGASFQAEFTKNKIRSRKTFDTEEEAENWISSKVTQHKDQGILSFDLTERQRVDALDAIKLLDDIKLKTAAEFYILHNKPASGTRTMADLFDEYLAKCKKNGQRPASITSINKLTGRLVRAFAGRPVHTITTADLDSWMDGFKSDTPGSRKVYTRYARMFFNYAVKGKFRVDNPAAAITCPRTDDKMPEVFTVPEVERLLQAAQASVPRILAYISLGFFAGLRCTELARLDWQDVDIAERLVRIRPEVSKVRKSRYVKMSDNLIAWLLPIRKDSGPIAPLQMTRRRCIKKLLEKAKVVRWAHNGLRHSFGSYHLAMHSDAPKTAFEMGHTNAQMLYQHYRALVKPDDAKRFWGIFPAESKVIQFPTAATASA